MMQYITEILVAILAFAGTAIGAYAANKKSTALIAYRLEQLEDKVDKHNHLVERMYTLERNAAIDEEQLRHLRRRVEELEKTSNT